MLPAPCTCATSAQKRDLSSNCSAVNCLCEPAKTWYDLLRVCLEEDAANSALSSAQSQALLAVLKKKIF